MKIADILQDKILVFDGACGTEIQKLNLTAEDYGGPAFEGCNENLLLTKPSVIAGIHESYLKAGADVIETDTFGSTRIVLAEYGLEAKAFEISKAGAALAKDLAKKHSTPGKPRFVAGSMGPTTKSLFITRNVTFDQLVESFEEQARGLLEGGADLLWVETCQDTLNIKAALIAARKAMAACAITVPVGVSVTIEPMGVTLAGQGVEALAYSLQQHDLFSLGLNCATGPDFMTDHVRTLSSLSRFAVSCLPNAGLPDEEGRYNETPAMIAQKLERFVEEGWVNILGGCCGTTPEHIALIAKMVQGKKPRQTRAPYAWAFSGLEPLAVTDDARPLIVGERANVIGSKLFRDMIVAGKFEEASEVARRQVRGGAHIIDVCLANPDRNEREDMDAFLDFATRKVKAPLMIDSTDPAVMEPALQKCLGRGIVNSVNLEDGEGKAAQAAALALRYGAALVVGTIDEDKVQGMAVTRERKLAIAKRCLEFLTKKCGLRREDIVFDPLTFPAATGDANYVGSAKETIEGIRLIKNEFPECKTILGVSNVSFGLPPAGREVLNAVFLHHCVEAGLDLAIVNAEKLARFAAIPDPEKKLCDDVLFADKDGLSSATAAFAAYFRAMAAVPAHKADDRAKLPIDERIARNVLEGSKEGLIDDLNALLEEKRNPLEIVNGPLMKGMGEVGRLFAKNEMIVAEVLQSAEVMKAAVTHLEPRMSQKESAARGKMVLATVKGDVHDIGKNLVHIILKNNGFDVVDLGIKVPPEDLIAAVKKHKPDMIGLSGLLVKSALQMVATAQDLRASGIDTPLLVGGAALSEKFAATKIAPALGAPVLYAKDAMTGLDLANRLTDSALRAELLEKTQKRQEQLSAAPPPAENAVERPSGPPPSRAYEPPLPPDLKLHIIDPIDLESVFNYINPVMLYGKHLGLRGQLAKLLAAGDEKAKKLFAEVSALQARLMAQKLIQPKAVFKFFPARAQGDALVIYEDVRGKRELERFDFPRQGAGEGLCLSDFVLAGEKTDYVAFFVVTCGKGVMALAGEAREKGDYFTSHALSAIAIEAAEGFAELLHEKIRAMWGFADPAGMALADKFQAKYRGLRVSFGYPACPRLEDQEKLFSLLSPDKSIGVKLTENYMMDPEASVSALVFHHPQAHYFSV